MMAHTRSFRLFSAAMAFVAYVLCLATAEAQLNFSTPVFYPTAEDGSRTGPASIATSDLDGDGDLDLVVANRSSDSVSILRNDGGSFTLVTTLTVGARPVFVTVVDLDVDGKDDIVVVNRLDNNVFVFRNTRQTVGEIRFANDISLRFNAGAGPAIVVPADLCGVTSDALLDLMVVNVNLPEGIQGEPGDGSDESISVLCNTSTNGTITLGAAIPFIERLDNIFSCCTSPVYAAAGHLIPESSRDDVVVAHLNVSAGNGIDGFSVLSRTNDPDIGLDNGATQGFEFEVDKEPLNMFFPDVVIVANLDNNPPEDLVFTERAPGIGPDPGGRNTIVVVLNTTDNDGFADFQRQPAIIVGAQPRALVAADVDNDGDSEGGNEDLDLIVVNRDSNNITVLLNNGNGTFTEAVNSPFAVGTTPIAAVAGDFDGDSDLDVAVANRDSDNVAVLLNLTINNPPVANDANVTTSEDTAVEITLTGSDPEGAAVTFAIGTEPTNGTLGEITAVDATSARVRYTPAANYNGADSFTFRVNDGERNSTPATVTLTVTPVNDAPVATARAATTDEDTARDITLRGSDTDGDGLTFAIVTGPTHGTLGAVMAIDATPSANVRYSPATNYNGADSFTFRVNDGNLNSAPATVTLTVTPVNDRPVATARAATTAEDTAQDITLRGSDVDGDSLTFTIATDPTHGTLGAVTVLDATSARVQYSPATNYNGADSFTFRVNDGNLNSTPATVTLTVTPVNDRPVATARAATTAEDTAQDITLRGSDVDGDSLTFTIATDPTHGTLGAVTVLDATSASVRYSPATNFNGADSFTFRVNDGNLNSAPATVRLTITPVNDPPVAHNNSISTLANTPVTSNVVANDEDVDDDTLTVVAVTQPANGTAEHDDTTVTYTPDGDFVGEDSFRYTISDGAGGMDQARVFVTVTLGNVPPVADNARITLDEDTTEDIILTGTDANNDDLTFTIEDRPMHGRLIGSPPTVRYRPNNNFSGTDRFTFRTNDSEFDSLEPGIIRITVRPVNDAPVAEVQDVSTVQDIPLEILLTGSDIEGDDLTFRVITGPRRGTLNDRTLPTVTYTANRSFTGTDRFTFVANDGELDSAEATVNITVTPCPADGDVNRDGQRTPADVVLAFTHYLGENLDACQRIRANVLNPGVSAVTSGDGRCIMQLFLNQGACVE